ncbi:hypothetical protein OA103_00190 [Gammaproteobacteria bacterium]|nr:hypothetical protein [Gammaproteobacteria bacterium]
MKKILIVLSLLMTFNAFGSPELVRFGHCFNSNFQEDNYDVTRCVNEYFRKGYEIIGTSYVKSSRQTVIYLARIKR